MRLLPEILLHNSLILESLSLSIIHLSIWFSKQQETFDASKFGSKFVALHVEVDMNDSLKYKLQMISILIHAPSNVLCNNNYVFLDATKVDYTLNKYNLSVVYHKVQNICAKGAARILYEHKETNLSNTCTKVLPSAPK